MKTSGWSPQPVRTCLLPLVFASQLLLTSASSPSNSYSSNQYSSNNTLIFRTKRQFGGGPGYGGPGYCPPNCFQCNFNQCNQMLPHHAQHLQQQPQQQRCMPMIVNCCCLPHMPRLPHFQQKFDIKTACDGDEAVAGCMNGLCGQGYHCTRRQFCCRCPNGKTIGEAVNGLCPAGYAPNANNFCCAIGQGSVLGKCINGLCPAGYVCGAGNLCYAKSSSTLIKDTAPATKSFPMPSRPVVRSRNKGPVTRRIAQGNKGNKRTKTRKIKRVGTTEDIALLSANRRRGNGGAMLSHPNNRQQSWIDEEGNVLLYDDYDTETTFMDEELGLINVFNAGGTF